MRPSVEDRGRDLFPRKNRLEERVRGDVPDFKPQNEIGPGQTGNCAERGCTETDASEVVCRGRRDC